MLAAALAMAMQVVPPPPPIVDYFPGPFFWPVEARTDRPISDFDLAVVRDAAALGTLAWSVCVERAVAGPADRRDRRLLASVRRRMAAAGIDHVRPDTRRCAPPLPARGVDGVMLHPVPR